MTNAMFSKGCQELCTSQHVSPRRQRADYRDTSPPMICLPCYSSNRHYTLYCILYFPISPCLLLPLLPVEGRVGFT